MKSILDIEVSCFANYNEVKYPKTVNLLAWLTSTKYKDKVDLIRSLDDKKERDAIKSTLPAITPSAILKHRRKEVPLKEKLIRHTGFIQIDLDPTEFNLKSPYWNDLKEKLIQVPQIAYLGQSVSGKGFWGLIPIPPDPDNHKGYFAMLKDIFLTTWKLKLDDKPINIASIRGYSYDLEGYFNHQANGFTALKKPVTVAKIPPKINPNPATDGQYQWLESWILSKISEAIPGDRHDTRLKYSRLAGGLIAGGYLPPSVEQSLIDCYLSQYGATDKKEVQEKEIKAINDGINEGMKVPVTPPPIRCLFVPFTDIKDYSDKAFKIWQGDRFYFVPKSTVYEILEYGFYVLEFFLTSEIKSPSYQSKAWKEFSHDEVCTHQMQEKKTLIKDDYQTEFDSTEAEINSISYKIRKTVQEFRKAKRIESDFRNKIRDNEIPKTEELSNTKIYRSHRIEQGY